MSISIGIAACFTGNKKLTIEELDNLIREHEIWLADRKQGSRLVLDGYDLSGADFHGRDLSEAFFFQSDLSKANFSCATLDRAVFMGIRAGETVFPKAKLRKAAFISSSVMHSNFSEADLTGFSSALSTMWDNNFKKADLSSASIAFTSIADSNLTGAKAQKANFAFSDLDYVDFSDSDCKNAVFTGTQNACYATYTGADLTGADFTNAAVLPDDLKEARGAVLPMLCPDEGAFIAWARCCDGKTAKLLIPDNAERSAFVGGFSFADNAKVLAVFDKDGNEVDEGAESLGGDLVFRKGEEVKGEIIFCLTREKAKSLSHEDTEKN